MTKQLLNGPVGSCITSAGIEMILKSFSTIVLMFIRLTFRLDWSWQNGFSHGSGAGGWLIYWLNLWKVPVHLKWKNKQKHHYLLIKSTVLEMTLNSCHCVLGMTLNSSVVVQGMTVILQPCLRFQVCGWGCVRWKAPCRKGRRWYAKLTWLALLSMYYIL